MLQPPTRAGMFTILALASTASAQSAARSVSGIYPHLAVYNDEGECGIGDGAWCTWQRLSVRAGEPLQRAFPDDFSAYWVRCTADADCRATAQLVYE